MKIKDILVILDKHIEADIIGVSREFCSYRGYYNQLAVAPSIARTMSVCEFYNVLTDQIGEKFRGYKGGEYRMTENTELYMATYGQCGKLVTGVKEVREGLICFITEEGQ